MTFKHTNIPQFEELEAATTANGRWYTVPTGKKYASVTTILGSKPKPAIEEWRNSLGPKKADRETKRCCDRGEAVHLMAEHYLNNTENPTKGHTDANIKLFNQLKFRLNKINNIRAQEIPMYSHSLRTAGRVDCVGEYDGVLSIIDFKTSNNNKDDKTILDYKLQCTAYALMYDELFDVQINDFVVLIAVEKGMMPLMFREKVDNYIELLLERINTFYKKQGTY